MNSIEYVEDIRPDGLLQIPPALLKQLGTTKKVRITLTALQETDQAQENEMDAATLKLLDLIKHAPDLGVPDDPELLRHSVLMEESIENRL